MTDYTVLSREIEEEYDACIREPERNRDELFEAVREYIRPIMARIIREGNRLDEECLDELSRDVLLELAEKGLEQFEKKEARFATYCGAIAKNKAIDMVRKRIRHREDLCGELQFENLSDCRTPEHIYIEKEWILEQYEMMKRYLYLLSQQKDKPYRTVGNCYTLVLYNLLHPRSGRMSSPGWAFHMLEKQSVGEGADDFQKRFHCYMPKVPFVWGDAFLDGMDEMEDGGYVSDIIFGERFDQKDFENWSLRFRKKMRRELAKDCLGLA